MKKTIAICAAALGVALLAPAASRAGAQCSPDLFITLTPDESLLVRRDRNTIHAWGATGGGMPSSSWEIACPLAGMDRIDVVPDPFPYAPLPAGYVPHQHITIDLSGGPLGPGRTREIKGISELEIGIATSGLYPTALSIIGSRGNDHITAASRPNDVVLVNLNGDDDYDVTASPIATLSLSGGSGNDTLGAAGGNGESAMSARVSIAGNDGNDTITGGSGSDDMVGGAGNDLFYARDGGKDRIEGGGGLDRAQIDRGLDTVIGIESLF